MPNKEKYGAQPPLELVRQWFGYGGWYDRKSLEFNKIVIFQNNMIISLSFQTKVDIHFTAAMSVGRAALS